jgi:hypothetical protein
MKSIYIFAEFLKHFYRVRQNHTKETWSTDRAIPSVTCHSTSSGIWKPLSISLPRQGDMVLREGECTHRDTLTEYPKRYCTVQDHSKVIILFITGYYNVMVAILLFVFRRHEVWITAMTVFSKFVWSHSVILGKPDLKLHHNQFLSCHLYITQSQHC